jgi:hypothetical protein
MEVVSSLVLRDTIHVVGLTSEGEVPLLRTLSDDEAIALPGVAVSGEDEGCELRSVARLLERLGYEARELVALSRYGIPSASGGRSNLLMAPLLSRRPLPRRALPGLALHEIAIGRAVDWLREQRSRGARVNPGVWIGLLLLERQFPIWARARVRASLRDLRRRSFSGERIEAADPRVRRESARGA